MTATQGTVRTLRGTLLALLAYVLAAGAFSWPLVLHLQSRIPAVDYVVLTAGSFDILAEVVCENDDDLIELLNKQIRGIEGVQSTETFVYLRLLKQFYNWGTR